MYIDAVVVKGEGKSFSVQINTVKDGATTNLTANDFVPFPLSGYDENGNAFAYSVILRVLGAPTADAEVLVEHLITENSDMEVDGQIDNPTNGQFTFTINKDDTDVLGLGKFPIQIILVDAESLTPQFTLTEGGERENFLKYKSFKFKEDLMADFNYFLNRQGVRGLPGVKGDPGDSPIITVQTETPNEYILKITNPDGTELISPNLRGNKININEGTYVRYNTETGELYTSTADGATGELAGVVRLATDVDITNMDERAVVTPSQLADALSQYLVSPNGSVKIVQNADTSLTELTVTGGLTDVPIASADTLGVVKIGENLSITEDGVLSSTAGGGDVSASGDNTFTGTNNFNGAVNLNGIATAENLTVTRNLTSSGEINAVSIKSTGIRSDDIKTTANKKYLTEEDVDNQTIQIVEGKLHANLDELGNKVNSLSGEVTSLSSEVTDLSGRVTTAEADILKKQNKLVQGDNITLTNNVDGTTTISASGTISPTVELVDGGNASGT